MTALERLDAIERRWPTSWRLVKLWGGPCTIRVDGGPGRNQRRELAAHGATLEKAVESLEAAIRENWE